MKITKGRLKEIIEEEVARFLQKKQKNEPPEQKNLEDIIKESISEVDDSLLKEESTKTTTLEDLYQELLKTGNQEVKNK